MAPGRLRAAFAALEDPQFRWLFASNTAFFLGMQSQWVVRGWLAFELTGSEFALGMVSFALAVPMLVVSPLGGALADRVDRRRLIQMGQLLFLSTELATLVLFALDLLRFWHLLASALLLGSVFPIVMPARQALIVDLIGRSGLTRAMALNTTAVNATRIVGPALGGLVIPLGIDAAYGVGIAIYAVALSCLFGIHVALPKSTPGRASIGRDILEGFAYLRSHRIISVMLAFGLIPMFLVMPFQALLVVFAREVWGVGSVGLGVLGAVVGAGAISGSLILALRGDSERRLLEMIGSLCAFCILLLLFANAPSFAVALPLLFAANIFASLFSILNTTAIQLLIPDEVRGRISSFLMMSMSLPMLGTLPLSALAEAYGVAFALTLTSCVALGVGLAFYAASPALRRMDASIQEALRA